MQQGGVNTHGLGLDESIAKTNSNYFTLSFPSSLQPTKERLFHFTTCRDGLSCDGSGELQWRASDSACLQGNPDIPFQINLDSSAFINRAHSGGFNSSFRREKKNTGQNVSPLKSVLHLVTLEIRRPRHECSCSYHLFDCDGKNVCPVHVGMFVEVAPRGIIMCSGQVFVMSIEIPLESESLTLKRRAFYFAAGCSWM